MSNAHASDQPFDDNDVVLDYGLRAQVRLLPYALGFFGIGLPIYIWSASLFLHPLDILINLALFACVWTAFFLIKPALHATGTPTRQALHTRLRRQWLCGGLWAVSLLVISLASITAGPEAQVFSLICAGAAAGVIFFSTPVLLYLLTLAPLAMAGPILALNFSHPEGMVTQMVSGGLALALAFGLILNRHLQEHYRLAHEQLVTAREREAAQTANAALSRDQMALMQTLSHELAAGLKGVRQTLHQGLPLLSRAPAPRHYVESACDEIDHLLGLITTTVDEDEARSGHLSVNCVPLDIDTLLKGLYDDFSGMAAAKGLDLTLTLPAWPDHGAPVGDVARVEQITSHLLANAIQYTLRGKVEIKVLPPAGTRLRIEIVDSGPGLESEELKRAFLPHERIARTSAGHSGAGLGLNLSHRLAELMGGELGAQSTLDVGSKFWLDLPFDPQADRPRPALPDEAPPAAQDATDGLKVMLVTNDSLRSAQLRDALEALGHRCLTATTRQRALSLAAKGPLDAVLIAAGAVEDLGRSDQTAEASLWLEQLRATQSQARLNILALLPDGEQAENLDAMGISPLLPPTGPEILRRALART